MGRYNKYREKTSKKPEANPIWRGVGCIFMVAFPLISFGLAFILTPAVAATGLVPPQLLGQAHFSAWVFKVPGLADLAIFLMSINNLWLGVALFFIILLLLTGVFSLVNVMILQVIGPPRYSELDAPPSTHKSKAYKR